MAIVSKAERSKILTLVRDQETEIYQQSNAGITVRMATITCQCGAKRAVVRSFKCLYCHVWFCQKCAEEHFGKTVEQNRKENPVED